MNVVSLRQSRSADIDAMRRLVATAGDRAFTEAEAREWDRLDLSQGRKREQIDALEPGSAGTRQFVGDRAGLELVERELSESAGTVAARRQDSATGVVVERALSPRESMRDYVLARSRVDPEIAKLDIGEYLRARILGPRNALERRALSEGSDSAGGYTVPDILSAAFVDKLRSAMVCVASGARTVPLTSDNLSMARLASDPVSAWPLEAGTVSTGDPVFERVLFTPRSLACLVKCSVELLQDSVNIEDILTRAFTQSMAVEVDRVCLAGTGVAPQPLGIRNAPGVGEIAAVGAPTNYDVLVNLASLIWTKNTAPTAYIMSPREFATFGKLKEATTNAPLAIPPVIADIPRRMTTSVLTTEAPGTASTVFAGDFSQMLIGVRSSIRIDTLKERFSDTLELGFIAWLRCDPQLVIPGAFARAIGVLPGTLLMAAEAEEPSPKAKK